MVSKHELTIDEVYKREIAEMQKQNHYLLVRVKELSDEINLLRKQLEEKK